MTNEELLNCAEILKKYCRCQDLCCECPFSELTDGEYYDCKIHTPYHWKLILDKS